MYRYLPPATQVVLISATLPHEILEMTNKFMTDPIRILVKRSVERNKSNVQEVFRRKESVKIQKKNQDPFDLCECLCPSVMS